ncbi:hypothetical protein [Goekera deserti]|uniref:Uncharacterized protein n=1 Tax=Goekera deserti TaxID=2497753 RepID=A0A7K3WE47_9ACTN|nr:hypothetical protein [Goekera deserti]NDI48221.1 hypothetical protein [Goekera deserti]NEL53970.1 hypothetical protein [Goekera deserti]
MIDQLLVVLWGLLAIAVITAAGRLARRPARSPGARAVVSGAGREGRP